MENLTYMQPFSPIVLVAHSEVSWFESAAWNALSIVSSAVGKNMASAICLCIVYLTVEGRFRDFLKVMCVVYDRCFYTYDSGTYIGK